MATRVSLPVIVVFSRIPRLGVGKRRLARTVGDRAAWRLSRIMLSGLLREMRRLRGVVRHLAATPDHHARLATPGFIRTGQGRGDLGARMLRVFRRHPRRPVIIIGSDIPGITAADLRGTLRRLRGAQAVFGPATDGGYWLIGLAGRRPAAPFRDVRWSSPHALADTLRNFPRHRVALLRPLTDLDDADSFGVHARPAASRAIRQAPARRIS
ncbi:MAG: TIGR04282 family arsenosugar biosynthesis glycosyltransferase [Rhodospirillales bacterium]|nr:TIGR04282 family arsenosugar biosynthesis glycosyltransferase [Rhodospirillales bacterium]